MVYAEGEEERVLRAVQTVVDEGLAHPTLIGRRDVILAKTRQLGLRLDFDKQARILDPLYDREFFAPLTERYQRLVERRGVQPDSAARWIATRHGIAAAMLLDAGEVDAALCGGLGDWTRQLTNILPIIPRQHGVSRLYSLSGADPAQRRAVLLRHPCQCRSHRRADRGNDPAGGQDRAPLRPGAQGGAAVPFQLRRLPVAQRHQDAQGAVAAARRASRDFEIDGEMHADAALSEALRARIVSNSPLTGSANLLVMPTLDAANIALTLLSAATEGLAGGAAAAGRLQADACHGAIGHRARYRQHDGPGRGPGRRAGS